MSEWEINPLSKEIIGAAMKVHSALGPGLLESAYHGCLLHELKSRGIRVESEIQLPVHYNGTRIELGYRLDMIVEDLIIVELKAVDALIPIHQAQLISYLRLSGKQLGLLINFNVLHLKDGIKRIANGLKE